MTLSGHFVDAAPGRVFVTAWKRDAARPSASAVILVPPAVEELNNCRRQLAQQARALVAVGIDAFLLDYYGTGDSEGQDSEASFSSCCQSLSGVVKWLGAEGYSSIVLLGVRVGAMIAAAYLSQPDAGAVRGLIVQQPLESGSHWVNGLRRLSLLGGGSKDSGDGMWVAGYSLSKELVEPLGRFVWSDYEQCMKARGYRVYTSAAQDAVKERVQKLFSGAQSVRFVDANAFWSVLEGPLNEELCSGICGEVSALLSGGAHRDA